MPRYITIDTLFGYLGLAERGIVISAISQNDVTKADTIRQVAMKAVKFFDDHLDDICLSGKNQFGHRMETLGDYFRIVGDEAMALALYAHAWRGFREAEQEQHALSIVQSNPAVLDVDYEARAYYQNRKELDNFGQVPIPKELIESARQIFIQPL